MIIRMDCGICPITAEKSFGGHWNKAETILCMHAYEYRVS